jgi:trehalose synthase-fused probable maltokinase
MALTGPLRDRAVAFALQALPEYLPRQRWYPAKDAGTPAVGVDRILPLPLAEVAVVLVVWRVEPPQRAALRLFLPLLICFDDTLYATEPAALIGRLPDGEGAVFDALAADDVVRGLAQIISGNVGGPGLYGGRIEQPAMTQLQAERPWTVRRFHVEQSNTSIRIGASGILKVLRRLQTGINPELEIGKFLTEHARFDASPALLGWLELGDATLAILQQYVANDGDGWNWLLEQLAGATTCAPGGGLDKADLDAALARSLTWVGTLGERTAELHLAFATPSADPAFEPEPITVADRDGWIREIATLAERVREALERRRTVLDVETRRLGADFETQWAQRVSALDRGLPKDVRLLKTRLHGDYHLGQVLVRDDDAVIVDFEGEPLRPLSERRAKHVPLRDVAGMLRSFGYVAAVAASRGPAALPLDQRETAVSGLAAWERRASAVFFDAYFARAAGSPGCPADRALALRLVRMFAIEKGLYEVLYEFANRPSWVAIPLKSVLALMAASPQFDATA